jgi:hypothetical protein
MSFVCSFCGEHHDEEMLDIRARFPDPVFELSDQEREERVDQADDACVLDPTSPSARHFVRGLLEIPIQQVGDSFAYGAWVEVDEKSFRRIGDLWWDPQGAQEPAFAGFLANELEPYQATFGLAAELKLHEVDRVPSIRLRESSHPLRRDQQEGITLERLHELAATVD